jgi:hypothetical protein
MKTDVFDDQPVAIQESCAGAPQFVPPQRLFGLSSSAGSRCCVKLFHPKFARTIQWWDSRFTNDTSTP